MQAGAEDPVWPDMAGAIPWPAQKHGWEHCS
jgi:hypothetical protein